MRNRIIIGIIIFFVFISYSIGAVFANNPPDSGHSSVSVNSSVAADGSSTATVTVTLKDSSGSSLSGDTVSLSISSVVSVSPGSATLDSSGATTFTVKSNTSGTYAIGVVDNTSGTTLTNMANVTFNSLSPTPTPTPTPGNTCTDSAPGSTPQLISAVSSGSHQITLTWSQASSPVSYYLVSYGLKSGDYQYGNPNVGGPGTTSYTINSLATGVRYYFIVRAVNGCMAGNASNELSAVAGGSPTVKPKATPTDSPDVLENIDSSPTSTPEPQMLPSPTPTPKPSSFSFSINTLITIITIAGAVMMAVGAGGYFLKKKRDNR